jgi:integrase
MAKDKKQINVQPLKTLIEVQEMIEMLGRICGVRDRLLFLFGINTGLRISDIVKVKIDEVLGKDHFIVTQKKTGKKRVVELPEGLQKEIEGYCKDLKSKEGYLFPSRKGTHISEIHAYRQLVEAGKMLDRDDIGTHTMRKTFGYHHYKINKDVAILQEIFSHSAPSITLKYIGITQDEIKNSMKGFYLG